MAPGRAEQWLNWTVWTRADDQAVGIVEATVTLATVAHVAYMFAPQVWGKGYAREAMQAALADGATIMPIIGMPPSMSNDPERYVDEIFDEVLRTFSREDTLTTSLQDWRKGRRAEVEEVNGWVVNTLLAHGRSAPVNQRVVEIALQIEAGKLAPRPENVRLLMQR